jgi:thiamine-phosphate pyrophosphorylase
VDVIQLRERDLEASALASLTGEIVALARGTACRVVVNDRLDVALTAGAAGVHLRSDSLPPAEARALAPPGFLIGCSVHGLAEAVAVAGDVDYLIAGTVWPTASKGPGAPVIGLSGLAAIARAVPVPVLAIGGVDVSGLAEVARSGAAGAAAIGLFMRADEPGEGGCRAMPLDALVAAARDAFDGAWSAR